MSEGKRPSNNPKGRPKGTTTNDRIKRVNRSPEERQKIKREALIKSIDPYSDYNKEQEELHKLKLKEILEEKLKLQEALLAKKSIDNFEIFSNKFIKIINKKGEKVNLVFNEAQLKVDEIVNKLKEESKPVRLIILKARQMGLSTYVQARLMWHTVLKKNKTALIVAHTDSSTSSIFEKAKLVYNNLADNIRPLKRASNSKELIFDIPSDYKGNIDDGLNSRIIVETSGGTNIGRGNTYNYCHLSEFAFFEKDPKMTLSTILQAIPKVGETELFLESTAFGMNDFQELWADSVAGRNEWTPIFLPWHGMNEYRLPISNLEKLAFDIVYNNVESEDITKDKAIELLEINEYEQNLITLYNVDFEQIKWYRYTLWNDCAGNTDLMKQENPSNPEECFLQSGRPVFQTDIIIDRIQQIQNNPIGKRGEVIFKNNKYEFNEFDKGNLIIYKPPLAGIKYVIGIDTAEGNFHGDADACHVMDTENLEQVAVYHGRLDIDRFTEDMVKLGYYYNSAMLIPEVNFDSSIVNTLERLQYPKIYVRQSLDTFTHQYKNKYGFRTDSHNKKMIINSLAIYVRDSSFLINDVSTLREMLTYVYTKDKKMGADSGKHDDLVMALALTLEGATCGQQGRNKLSKDQINYSKIDELPVQWQMDFWSMDDSMKYEFAKRHGFLGEGEVVNEQ